MPSALELAVGEGNPRARHLGLSSGVGLVAGSMIGSGVLLSAGFMAQDLSAGWILLAWLIGAAIAGAGAVAYGQLARLVPRSGGEYRYLCDLFHPALGYLAGWGSLLLGFSAPIAVNALGAAAFLDTLVPIGDPRPVAALLVAAVTCIHAFDLGASRWGQDLLAAAKLIAILGFAALGLVAGEHSWPQWTPPPPHESGFALAPFMTGLFFVGFAYSGWNSSVYAASEFRDPRRDVPRSMLIGTALVALLYLAVNWVFVANLTPAQASVVQVEHTTVTLGHVVAIEILGDVGGALMSGFAVLAFVSAISAIIVIGPRVYAEMAEDGFLPAALKNRAGRPPVGSVLFQGAIAVVMLSSHSLRQVLLNASAILILFTALSAAAVIRVRLSRRLGEAMGRPGNVAVTAAALYVGASTWMLYYGFRDQPTLLLWVGVVAGAAAIGYLVTRRRRRG